MIALSFLLVVVAFATLVLGVFQDGLSMIWVSIAASVGAAVTLAVGVIKSRPRAVTVGAPEALGSWSGSATPVLDQPESEAAPAWRPEPMPETASDRQEEITSVLDLRADVEDDLPPIMPAPATARPRPARPAVKRASSPARKAPAAKAPAAKAPAAKAPAAKTPAAKAPAAKTPAAKKAAPAKKTVAKKAASAKKAAPAKKAPAKKAPARRTPPA